MNLQRTGCNPFAIFVVTSVLSYFTDIDFRVEVSCKCFMVVSRIAVYYIKILNFIEVMFGGIGCIDATYSWIESASEDGCESGFFETIVIGPLPTVFEMSFIFRFIISCIQIVYSGFQTCFHDG